MRLKLINRESLVWLLLFLTVLFSLSTPMISFKGIPLIFLLPAAALFFTVLISGQLDKDAMIFTQGVISVVAVTSLLAYLSTSKTVSLSSAFLFLVSIVIFMVFVSTSRYVLKRCDEYYLGLNAKRLLYLILFLCFFEIALPNVFIDLRQSIYPNDYLIETLTRDKRDMLGFIRPSLIFNEVSHLAKLTGVAWLVYAYATGFKFSSIFLLLIAFFALRSPTLFFIFPAFILFLNDSMLSTPFRKLILIGVVFLCGLAVYLILSSRIDNALAVGEGSLQERYIFPFMYMVDHVSWVGGFPAGGHQPMYSFTCEMMASTRDWWYCTENISVAANSMFMFLSHIGALGVLMLGVFSMTIWRLPGFFLFLSFIMTQFFLTGFNTPGNYILVGSVFVILLSASKRDDFFKV